MSNLSPRLLTAQPLTPRLARRLCGISAASAGAAIHVGAGTIRLYERRGGWSLRQAQALARLYHCDARCFLHRSSIRESGTAGRRAPGAGMSTGARGRRAA